MCQSALVKLHHNAEAFRFGTCSIHAARMCALPRSVLKDIDLLPHHLLLSLRASGKRLDGYLHACELVVEEWCKIADEHLPYTLFCCSVQQHCK